MPDAPTVSNSSCLIGLEAVGHLDILKQLYSTIIVPQAVAQEIGSAIPTWVQVHSVRNQPFVQSLMLNLGAGEAEAIALSVECSAARLLLDDKKARRLAQQMHQPVTGTLAVLLRAKNHGLLSNVHKVIHALRAANFRVSDALVQEVLRRAGE